jgi:hypothetical protein
LLKLVAELFAQYLTDKEKRRLAEELTEALMKEHLAKAGHGKSYRAPRRLNWRKAIVQALEDGESADVIAEFARATEDSARNAAGAS